MPRLTSFAVNIRALTSQYLKKNHNWPCTRPAIIREFCTLEFTTNLAHLKALNCREGKSRMEDFCRREGIEFEICGKVIVAVKENELPVLEMIYQRGRTNGVSCQMISHEQLRELEPHVAGIKAIHVPEAGIVDFMKVCERLAERICEVEGNRIVCSEKVIGVRQTGHRVVVQTQKSEYEGQLLVNCAGLYSDKITSMTQTPDAKIIPFRGEYFLVRPENIIYAGI